MIVRAVGYYPGDLVDPRVDLVAAAPFHFVVLLPPGDVFLQGKHELDEKADFGDYYTFGSTLACRVNRIKKRSKSDRR